MKTAAVERWLIKETLFEAILNVPVGIVCLAASLVVLALTTAVVFVASLIFFQIATGILTPNVEYRHTDAFLFCEIICSAFLIWLFVTHFRRNSETYYQARFRSFDLHVSNGSLNRALKVLLAGPGGEDGLFTQLLYIGPRWFAGAISMFYKSVTLLGMDIGSCAKILVIVLQKGTRVSFTELAQLVPECNSLKVFPQLRDIAGVIFLQTDPCGISLTSELRSVLSKVLGVKMKAQSDRNFRAPPRPPPARPIEPEPPGPHTILGVSKSASLAQIKAAYRKQIKQCHPDRFATLNKDWQQMAEQRSKLVNAAYATLVAGFSNRSRA